jgi:hypothetical protein
MKRASVIVGLGIGAGVLATGGAFETGCTAVASSGSDAGHGAPKSPVQTTPDEDAATATTDDGDDGAIDDASADDAASAIDSAKGVPADAALAPDGGDAGAACVGNASVAFASLAPYLVDTSTTCGTATLAGGAVDLTYGGACTASTIGGEVTLDPSAWHLCGDFDVQVAYTLGTFAVPAAHDRWAALRAFDPANTDGISIERYTSAVGTCHPSTETYKSWSTDASDCDGNPEFVPTTAVSAVMRVTRSGSTVTSYHWTAGGDGGGAWTADFTATGMTTTPWALTLYTGDNTGDATSQSVSFSNLVIVSASAP